MATRPGFALVAFRGSRMRLYSAEGPASRLQLRMAMMCGYALAGSNQHATYREIHHDLSARLAVSASL